MRHGSALPPDKAIQGHIEGIWLPRRAWLALEREKIRTLRQLADVAPRIERVIPGIGGKTARAIREQLGGIVLPEAASPVADARSEYPSRSESADPPAATASGTIETPTVPTQPVTLEQALRAMILWRAVCPHCGTRDIHVTEALGSSM